MAVWKRLRRVLESRFPFLAGIPNAGASDAERQRLSEYFGVDLPPALALLYANSNGQKADRQGYLLGAFLLSIDEANAEAESYAEIGNDDFDEDDFSSTPEAAIRRQYTNPKWIPIFHDGNGNFLGLDFDPGPRGTRGQLINFGRDMDDKCVLASDLERFLERCVAIVENDEHLSVDTGNLIAYRGGSFFDSIVAEAAGVEFPNPRNDQQVFSVWVAHGPETPAGYLNYGGEDAERFSKDFGIPAGATSSVVTVGNETGSSLPLPLLFRLESNLGAREAEVRSKLAALDISEIRKVLVLNEYDYASRPDAVASCSGVSFLGTFARA